MLHTMIAHNRALCLALIALSALLSTATAAPEQFRTLGWQLSLDDIYYEYKGENTPVQVYASARSTFYEYAPSRTSQPETAADSILFYRLGTNAEGEEIRIPVAQADLSKAGDWPLLIFRPNSSQTSGISVTAISDDLKSFPAPNFRFVNLTPAPLEIQMGKANTTVQAKSMIMIDPKIKGDGTETRFTTVTVDTQQGPRRIYSNNWAVRPNQRTMVLIMAKDGQLGVQRIVDNPNQHLSVLRVD